jgi:hypothetical protein
MEASKVVILSPRVEDISKATFDEDSQHFVEEELDGKRVIQQLSRD